MTVKVNVLVGEMRQLRDTTAWCEPFHQWIIKLSTDGIKDSENGLNLDPALYEKGEGDPK
jgi:hypothetical protein